MKRELTLLASTTALVWGFYACGGKESSNLTEGSGANGTGNTTNTTNNTSSDGAGGPGVGGNFQGSGGMGTGGNCADDTVAAQAVLKPADIIMMIDNSGSMYEENTAIEQSINTNFANILNAANVDYQVILIADRGQASSDPNGGGCLGYCICIGPPLAGSADCLNAPPEVPNQFYEYDVNVQSWDSACIALETMYGSTTKPDEWGNHTGGWVPLLRQNAIKFFIEVTDDRMNCTWNGTTLNDQTTSAQYPQVGQQAAVLFDQLLLQLAPTQFGTTAQRNYVFYSLVGVVANPLNPTQPYDASHPYVTSKCTSAVNTGPGYQWLSKGTGGWRFPVCDGAGFPSTFQKIADDVIVTTSVPCEINLPTPPPGKTLDPSKVEVLYTPDTVNPTETFTQVSSLAACGTDDDKFYIENDIIKLCPAACAKVSGNSSPDAEVKVNVQCGFDLE